jgi:glycosyltransferase involved in cell wall biosynthesis
VSDATLVSVVVPAYNEAAVIDDSLTRLVAHLATLPSRYRWEIVVVDDGSTDDTSTIAGAIADDHPGIRLVRHPTNLGLGHALRSGFAESMGDHVVVVDCDLSYAPEHITRMLDAAAVTGAHIVIASPYMRGGTTTSVPVGRQVLSRGANRLLAAADGGGLTTLTGMVRLYDGPFVRALDLRATDAGINTEIIRRARAADARIVEVPGHLDWSFPASAGRRRAVRGRLGGATVSSLRAAVLFRPMTVLVVGVLGLSGAAVLAVRSARGRQGRVGGRGGR